MAQGGQPIFILPEGTNRSVGRDAQRNNILAGKVLAETVRTTLGPKGMDKMLVDGLGDIVVTNDGVTILKEMDIEHPAAKMLVEVAKTQEDEVGDGTTTAVIIAGELLKKSESLLDQDIHPTIIAMGYRQAAEKAQEILDDIFEKKYEEDDSDFTKLVNTYTSYRDDTPLKDVILRIYTYIESNPFPLKWLKEQVEKFNIKDVKQDFSNTEWGKILLQNMKEELEDCIKKLQAEEKRLSFESELEQYERIILSDIQQLEMVYANLENWDKAYSLINNVDFLRWLRK